jgi:hypothetical protein
VGDGGAHSAEDFGEEGEVFCGREVDVKDLEGVVEGGLKGGISS